MSRSYLLIAPIAIASFALGFAGHAAYTRSVQLPRPESVEFSHTRDGKPYQAVYWFCGTEQHDASADCPVDYRASTHRLDPDHRIYREAVARERDRLWQLCIKDRASCHPEKWPK